MISEENWGKERFMGNFRGKLKRKEAGEIDQVSYEFSDFSLSSRPNKIRRLNAELPPIIEEEEEEDDLTPECPIIAPTSSLGDGRVIEELSNDSDSNKAMVVFKPFNPAALGSCSNTNVSFSIDSHFMSGFKDQFIQSSKHRLQEEDDEAAAAFGGSNQCKAVVPLAPSRSLSASADTMEVEKEEEDSNGGNTQTQPRVSAYGFAAENLPQWQQKHCMLAQPQNNISSTPISWFH